MINHEGKNLVFLLSLPRSGSTILSLLLNSHSAVTCPAEPWFLLKLSQFLNSFDINTTFDEGWARLGTREFLTDPIFTVSSRTFAAAAYNEHLKAVQKTVFVDKTPRYFHILDFIDRLFPRARKVWLKRNPLDVAVSYMRTWGINMDVISGTVFKTVSLDFGIGLFRLAQYFAEPSPYKFEIKYESLVKDPTKTLRDLCRKLGIAYEESMLDYSTNITSMSRHSSAIMGDPKAVRTTSLHPNSIDRWRRHLSHSEITALVQLIGLNIFHRMGYDDVGVELSSYKIPSFSEPEAAHKRTVLEAFSQEALSNIQESLTALQEQFRPHTPGPITTKNKLLRKLQSWLITRIYT